MFEKYDAYKDSGVEWLGKIPANWTCIKMKFLYSDVSIKGRENAELLSVTQDRGVIPRTWVENRMVMPSGNLESFKYIQKGDFAISLRSFEGGLEYCYHDGIISPAYTVLKKKIDDLKEGYYKYLFKSKIFISELQTSIVGIREGKNISYEELRYSYLPIPSEIEQHKIACYLDQKATEIDQAIAIKEQQIALLNERQQIVIQKAVTQGLDPNVPMKNSGVEWIGKIPEHWEIKKLKFICQSQGRIGFKGYSSDDLVEQNEGALTLGATHLNWNGDIILDQPVYLSWKKYYESPEIMVKKDDILIVQRGSTCGKVAIVDKDYGEVTINPSLVLLKEFRENPYFCVEGIKVVLNGILNEVSKTAIPMISQFQINNIQIALPPLEEQLLIVKKVQEVTAQYAEINKFILDEINKLKEYKTTLINDAVTGKIKVA